MTRRGWTAALGHAARLGLTPAEFWALSLREWRALTEGKPAEYPLRRAELEALIRHHTSGDRYEQQG